jgi:hypothetical protein
MMVTYQNSGKNTFFYFPNSQKRRQDMCDVKFAQNGLVIRGSLSGNKIKFVTTNGALPTTGPATVTHINENGDSIAEPYEVYVARAPRHSCHREQELLIRK